ncbi:MAG: DUF6786 family protein [Verrucomicrobiae bacterium]|nr:DUF6786 family protein [Verrucomicrobiae bacterium]
MTTWKSKNGLLIVSPDRGRILQAQVGGQDAFWVNGFWRKGWNVGGDRLWVGPELSWFWKTREEVDFNRYEVQKNLDDDNWKVSHLDDKSCYVEKKINLKYQHAKGQGVRLSLERGFALSEMAAPHFARHIVYTTENKLSIREGSPGLKVDLWCITQIPAGGVVYTPYRGESSFRNYFQPITDDLWENRKAVMAFDITGKYQYKIGISPKISKGRLAYVRELGNDQYMVVYRELFSQQWRPYCDSPMDEPDSQGDVIQVYNDNGDFGGFGEFEHHSPSLTCGERNNSLTHSNVTIVGLVHKKSWNDWYRYWLVGEGD